MATTNNPNGVALLDDSFQRGPLSILTPYYTDSSGDNGSGHWSINSANLLLCSGSASPATLPGHVLSWFGTATDPGYATLNQEVWIQFSPTGLNAFLANATAGLEFGILLRMGDTIGTGMSPSTFFKFNLDYQNLTKSHFSQFGYDSSFYVYEAHNLVSGHQSAFHAYAIYDEIIQQTVYLVECLDLTVGGSVVTPFGNATQVSSYSGAYNTLEPGLATHLSHGLTGPGDTPGSLCSSTGHFMGIYCNPNGGTAANAITITRIVWNDPLGLDIRTAAQGQAANQQRVLSYPGPLLGYNRGNILNGNPTGATMVCQGSWTAPNDCDEIQLSILGNTLSTPGWGDTALPNSYGAQCSIMYPANAFKNTPYTKGFAIGNDGLNQIGPFQPLYLPNGKRYGICNPDSRLSWIAAPPQGIKQGDVIAWRIQVQAAAPGLVPYCYAASDDAATIQNLDSLIAPTVTANASYTGYGSYTTGTYYIAATLVNDSGGETAPSTAIALTMSTSGPITSVTYGVDGSGRLTVTDTGLALAPNSYAGARVLISGNYYSVVKNTATQLVLNNLGWIGGTPVNGAPGTGTAFVLSADTINAQAEYMDGADSYVVYAGTVNTNSTLYRQSDPVGCPLAIPVQFLTVFATSGANPPTSNAGAPIKNYTTLRAAVSPPNKMWVGASGGTPYIAPIITGQCNVEPTRVFCIGTSITAGAYDFAQNQLNGFYRDANASAGLGWIDRTFRNLPNFAMYNAGSSGSHFVQNLADYHGRQWSKRLEAAASCGPTGKAYFICDHFTNDALPLPLLEAFALQLINMCKSLGLLVIWPLPLPRMISTDCYASLANQSFNNGWGLNTSNTNRQGLWSNWLRGLVTAGTIFAAPDLTAPMCDAATGKFLAIGTGTTYYDPSTYAATVWPAPWGAAAVAGTVTASSTTTLTDSGANSGSGWAVNQWYNTGQFGVVTQNSSGATTAGIINGNTANQLTGIIGQQGASVFSNGAPGVGKGYTIFPMICDGPIQGVHPVPHGAAMMKVYMDLVLVPRMPGAPPVYTINDLPARGPLNLGGRS